MSLEHIEELKRSKLLVGELSPIIIDFDGEELAGSCRRKAGFIRTYHVDSRKLAEKWDIPVQVAKERVRLNSNIQRKVSAKETRGILLRMAKAFEERGLSKEMIALQVGANCPFSQKYVWELLPEEYKNPEKVAAGRLGGEATSAELNRPKPQDSRQPTVEVRKYKPPETPEYRRAVMTPGISKMDEAVYLALQQDEALRKAGWKFEFQKRYCVKRVKSDVTATRGDVVKPLFLDGEVHKGKEDRDEANRTMLARRLRIPEVLAFTYEGAYSDAKRDEIVAKIKETLI